jgi:polysaccharide export outer membrane protein
MMPLSLNTVSMKVASSIAMTCIALSACRSPAPKPAPAAIGLSDDSVIQALWRERTAGGIRTEPCLGPGDLIEISVFRWPDIQGYRARVSPAGMISLPLLGNMRAAGLTESQLRDQIANGLKQSIMRDPQVSVFVAEYVSQQVSVTGAVARPGLIGLSRDHRTISDMISEAGGFNEHAGGRIQLVPGKGTSCDGTVHRPGIQQVANVEPIEIDVNEQYASAQSNPLLLPAVGGDQIIVNRGRFSVDGWVTTPGAYDIAPGMTAMGGISAAGGAVFAGDMSNVKVWRPQRGGTKKLIEVNMKDVMQGGAKDVTLQAGDVIEVPASTVKMVPYSAYWVLTTVVRVGASFPIF